MISRYFVSLNIAALITFSMFYAMQMLISNGDIVLEDPGIRVVPKMWKIRAEEELKKKIKKPLKPEDVDIPETPVVELPDGNSKEFTIGEPEYRAKLPTPTDKVDINVFKSEGGYTVLLRPAPQYPTNLAEKGIEGYVRVKYTIDKSGKTENVIVVNSSHRGFERSAVKAAEKFLFKPEIVDGQPQSVEDVYSLIEFKLES